MLPAMRNYSVLNERKLDEICKHLDELSSHWSNLEVGQSIAVRWPDLAIVATGSITSTCLNMQSQSIAPHKVHNYPCLSCGADLLYEPQDGFLSCPYCGHKETIPQSARTG